MAVIELTEPVFYMGGKSGVSRVVGNDFQNNAIVSRVARYTFVAPETGAQRVSLTLHTGTHDGGWIPLRFFIGTDPESHGNAGIHSEYTGELVLGEDYLTFTGEAEILLIPGATYYLWVFPASEQYGYYGWYSTKPYTMETDGSASLANIIIGGELQDYGVYLFVDGSWWMCAVYVYDGTRWCPCGGIT